MKSKYSLLKKLLLFILIFFSISVTRAQSKITYAVDFGYFNKKDFPNHDKLIETKVIPELNKIIERIDSAQNGNEVNPEGFMESKKGILKYNEQKLCQAAIDQNSTYALMVVLYFGLDFKVKVINETSEFPNMNNVSLGLQIIDSESCNIIKKENIIYKSKKYWKTTKQRKFRNKEEYLDYLLSLLPEMEEIITETYQKATSK